MSFSIGKQLAENYVIFFIGDIVVAKCQHQIIDVLFALKAQGIANITVVLGGQTIDKGYKSFLSQHIILMNLENEVVLLENNFEENLSSLYLRADLYLSLSEDNENNIWILEAIKHNIPVLFYASNKLVNNTLEKLKGRIRVKAPAKIAEIIAEIIADSYVRTRLIKNQYNFLQQYEKCNLQKNSTPKSISFRIDGPCDSTYSLALVNQELGKALIKKRKKTSFFTTEGPGDYKPNKLFLQNYNKVILSHLIEKPLNSQTVIRNLYPPRVSSMNGVIKILGPYGWEESAFPQLFVEQFNRRLSGIACMSSYVAQVLKNNGVKVPLCITGIGVDHILCYSPKPLSFTLPNGLKLLHISSSFPRKGLDLLIQAIDFISEPLTLIIKTFPNPHNTLRKDLIKENWITENSYFYNKNNKKVVIIEDDLTMGQIRFLYETCDLVVAPSRGEGFGLPIAEAMLLGTPVVTTGYGGQMDFCSPDVAWLVNYVFVPAKTHMNLPNSLWAEPILSDLVYKIVDAINSSTIMKRSKIEKARKVIQTSFTWERVAQKIIDFQKSL